MYIYNLLAHTYTHVKQTSHQLVIAVSIAQTTQRLYTRQHISLSRMALRPSTILIT